LWKGLLTSQIGAALVQSGKFADGLAKLQEGAELTLAQGHGFGVAESQRRPGAHVSPVNQRPMQANR
jgi:hypothetical protein